MQNMLSLLKDVRGCMTRFDPLTPEIVAAQTDDGLTYDELKAVLGQCGMDIEKVVFDSSRSYQNAFSADFEQGHYCWIPFQKKNLKEVIRVMDEQFHSPGFGKARQNHEWETFYMMDVPLPMQIWDFEHRYKAIEPAKVFSVWSYLHTHIDYVNGMWKPEVLDYVFAHAPQTELPEPDENGMVTMIYCEHSCMVLSEEDKQILIYFSLLHNIGRDSESEDETHGNKRVDLIRIKGCIFLRMATASPSF